LYLHFHHKNFVLLIEKKQDKMQQIRTLCEQNIMSLFDKFWWKRVWRYQKGNQNP